MSADFRMFRFCLCLLFLPLAWSLPLAGWVESPGYPRGYEPFSTLTWARCAPPGHALTLALTHLDLEDGYECENDALKVYADGSLISTLCGRMSLEELRSSVNPSLLSSSGGCLNLSFSADYSNTERHTGFRGFYTIQDYDECDDPNIECSHFCLNFIGGYMCTCPPGYVLDADKHTCSVHCTEDLSGSRRGQVTPPGSPGPYAEDAHCSYSLSVEEGLQLVLEFTEEFDVEAKPSGECADAVKIKTPSQTLGPYCGRVPPSPIHTGSSQVQILFDSDNAGINMGFTVAYKTDRMTCPKELTTDSTLEPKRQQYWMGDTVTVTCDTGTVVDEVVGPGIKTNMTFESRCQLNGLWEPLYTCEKVRCEEPTLLYPLKIQEPLSTLYGSEIQFTCDSNYYKLDSDEVFTCKADGLWKSRTGQTKIPRCLPVCGQTHSQISSGRILGGMEAKLGQIPWQLLIKRPNRAGASLISDRWAITAAHVVDNVNKLMLYGGMVVGNINPVEMETDKIIIHPQYERNKGTGDDHRTSFDNDIALLKMSSRVKLNANLLPICLPEKGAALELKMGTVSGYGMTENKDMSGKLRYANIEEYKKEKCNETPDNEKGERLIFTENMFCAGWEGRDSCRFDSGGPLFVPMVGMGKAEDPYRLKGIVSWGSDCRQGDNKGYYTKVQKYLDWIRDTIAKEDGD
ncbi:complement C1s subcomponent [Clupea harengus]|uniref:Complement C1s subcomponent n=1 Tax=Clupea harengus TaxID=7950 RepID=A0A6P3VY92_CLUHA|nr:complement C1s subcomponent [Clupea harengus]